MKSVIHEASSITKAISQAWEKAGKPADFSVKVLEEAEKNFFGFTKRSAKIALFFGREVGHSKSFQRQPEKTRSEPRRESRKNVEVKKIEPVQIAHAADARAGNVRGAEARKNVRPVREPRPQVSAASEVPLKQASTDQTKPVKQYNPLWNDAMVVYAKGWLDEALRDMNIRANFTVELSRFHLRITFSEHLLPDSLQERRLFASFSVLIFESLKRHFKLGLQGHKIILAHHGSTEESSEQESQS